MLQNNCLYFHFNLSWTTVFIVIRMAGSKIFFQICLMICANTDISIVGICALLCSHDSLILNDKVKYVFNKVVNISFFLLVVATDARIESYS